MHISQQTVEECCRFLQQIEDSPLVIQFHGGEPLLDYDKLVYIVNTLLSGKKTEQQIMFGVTTNAAFLDHEKIDYLSKYMNFGFSISLDGNKKVNDMMRISNSDEGTYESIIEQTKLALEMNHKIRIRLTFTPETVPFLFESVKHCVEIGARIIAAHPDYFNQDWTYGDLDIYQDQLMKIKQYYDGLENKADIDISLLDNKAFKKTKCTGGTSSLHVSPEGKLFPCVYTMNNEKYCIGNVTNGVDMKKLRDISKVNELLMEECVGCTNYDGCLSVRCRYLNEIVTGESLNPSPIICAFENVNISSQTVLER